MARLKDVVDECLTVSTAFTSINSQTFNELSAVNFEDNDKSFPFYLFDKRSFDATITSYTHSTNLPSASTYSVRMYFMNTYTEAEKLTTTLQEKIDALMIIAEQYFAELKTRNESGANGFYLGDISFGAIDETNSDRLIQLSYTVEVFVKREDCTVGTFVY